jgi:curved DNA-binding protein CbpA
VALTFYDLLGVAPTATDKEIIAAYRAKARHYHPDKDDELSSEAIMRELNAAKEILLNASKRRDYDYELAYPHTQDQGQRAYRSGPEPHYEEPVYEQPKRPSASYTYQKRPTRDEREAAVQRKPLEPRDKRLLVLAVVLWVTAPLFGGLGIGALNARSILAFLGSATFIAFIAFGKSKVARAQAAIAAWRDPSEPRDLTKDKTPTAP